MNLEAAADELGVHYQTVWRWVRAGLLPAVMVQSGYDVDPADVSRFAETRYGPPLAGQGPAGTQAWRATLAEALAAGDEGAARSVVAALDDAGTAPVAVCEDVIVPALGCVAERRAAGELSAADQCLAVGICERLVGLLAFPPPGRPRGTAVVAGPETGGHRLAGLLATVALRSDRWRVHDLGPNVPAGDIAQFTAERRPDVLVLTAPIGHRRTGDLPATIEETAAVPVLWYEPDSSLAELLSRVRRIVAIQHQKS